MNVIVGRAYKVRFLIRDDRNSEVYSSLTVRTLTTECERFGFDS